jgi:hypothetical protein
MIYSQEKLFGEFSLFLKVLGVLIGSRKTVYNVQQAILNAYGQALVVSNVL